MSYSAADARQQILDELAGAAERLGEALAALGEAYERMEEHAADRLEERLFGPVQVAYGRARRTHTEFARRHQLPERTFSQAALRLPTDPRHSIEQAVDALRAADETLATLQDSMLPVDVGDPELRAGLSAVRELIAPMPSRARALTQVLGR